MWSEAEFFIYRVMHCINFKNIEMTKLEELNKEFKKYRQWGYNQYESAERAVNEVFADINVKPHIYQDKYEDASHIFFEKQVLFFDGSIYSA